ncbi:MAG: 6-carboxytetrahydropterin synthase [Myxococcota bacterium]
MFSVTVRDHMMIAHRLKGEVFGPAQKLHGATYVVDVELRRAEIDRDGIVVDIARATSVLREILQRLNYQDLDELDEFHDENTTTEFLAKWIFDRIAEAAASGKLGPAASGLASMRVSLQESHIAWASYEGSLENFSDMKTVR